MKRAPSIPVGSLVPTPPHTHKRLSKYAVLNEVSFIITGLECGTGVPAHMLPTLGPFPSSFRRRLSEPERTNSTLTHTHYTRRLTHLHSECARVTDNLSNCQSSWEGGLRCKYKRPGARFPSGPNSTANEFIRKRQTSHTSLPTSNPGSLESGGAVWWRTLPPFLHRSTSAKATAVATPPPSGRHWERGGSPAPAVQPCPDRCPLVAQCLEVAQEDDPWHPGALTVRSPCFSGRDMSGRILCGATSRTVEESRGAGRKKGSGMGGAQSRSRKGLRKTLRFPQARAAWGGWTGEPEIKEGQGPRLNSDSQGA